MDRLEKIVSNNKEHVWDFSGKNCRYKNNANFNFMQSESDMLTRWGIYEG